MNKTTTIDSLLAESDWLLALARQLVRSEDRAQDLYQDTLLASIRAKHQLRGEVRPWLRRIAQRVALGARRQDQARSRREERVAQPEAEESVAETVGHFEMHRIVVDAVNELDEPYRTTVLLRFWEDLPPREISRRTGSPVETVKTRLKRGMDLLRARLDRDAGDRKAWMGMLLPVLAREGLAGGTAASLSGLAKWAAALVLIGLTTAGYVMFVDRDQVPIDQGQAHAAVDARRSDHQDVMDMSVAPARRSVEPRPTDDVTEADALLVRVVDDAGVGVEGASVVSLDKVELGRERLLELRKLLMRVRKGELDPYSSLGAVLTERITDHEGIARLPGTQRQAALVAYTETLDGTLVADAEEGELTIRLKPKVEIPVLAVNQAGQAVPHATIAWFLAGRPSYCVQTGDDGTAVLRCPFARANSGDLVEVGLVALQSGATLQRVEVEAVPAEPLRFVVHDSGMVRVEVRDEFDELVVSEGVAQLSLGKPRISVGFRSEGLLPLELKSGAATFSNVGIGIEFTARVQLATRREPIVVAGFGPRIAGEMVTLVVRDSSNGRFVEVRLLDVEGAPICDSSIELQVTIESERSSSRSGRSQKTNAEGVLRIDLENTYVADSLRIVGLWRTDKIHGLDRSQSALLDLSRSLANGPKRLPDVTMTLAPVVATGTVIDTVGAPVAGASILVSRQRHGNDEKTFDDIENADDITTDAEGRFVVRGQTKAKRMQVVADKAGWYSKQRFTGVLGAEQIELVIDKAAALVVTFTESSSLRSELTIHLAPSKGEPQGEQKSWTLFMKKMVRFERIPPGRYDLHVESGSERIMEVQSILVQAGENQPPGLQAVDLSHLVRSSRITVLDPMGQPVDGQRITHWSGNSGTTSKTDKRGIVEITHGIGGADITLQSEGFRSVSLRGVDGDRTIHLVPAIAVVLRIDRPMPGDLVAGVALELSGEGKDPHLHGFTRAPWAKEVRLLLPGPGVYSVTGMFSHSNWSEGMWPSVFTPKQIEVRDEAGVQHFNLSVDAADLSAAQQRHRRRIKNGRR